MQADEGIVVTLADFDRTPSQQRPVVTARQDKFCQPLDHKEADDRVERADDIHVDFRTRNAAEKPGPRLVSKWRFGTLSSRARLRTNKTVAADMLP